ncbi:MAG TPA: tetratricopeptide repeat protein, partial [Isosphaeraceae bacterium]|nr:tetratricopeptide repeat protein [Isosphaeraceae bacterium]
MPIQRLCLVVVAGLSLTVLPSVRADTVRLLPDAPLKNKAPGGQFSGQITAETPTEVKIKTALGEQSVPLDQIDGIEYDAATPSFTLAESRMNVNAVGEAIDLYSKAIDEAKGKPLVERAAQYGKAQALADTALADPSKLDEAIASLGSFIQANGSSRQLGPALESMIQLNLMKGDIARAENALGDLEAKVPTAKARVSVLKARILGKKGQHDQAIQGLDQLIAQAPKGSAQSREAMLAKAENLVALKKFSDAETVVRQVIQEAPAEADEIQA